MEVMVRELEGRGGEGTASRTYSIVFGSGQTPAPSL